MPEKLYHATFGPLMQDILAEGLLPGGKDIQNFEDIPKGVYLGITPEFCESMVEASENKAIPEDWFGDYVIFEVDIAKLDASKLVSDPCVTTEVPEAFLYMDAIPVEAIKIFDGL